MAGRRLFVIFWLACPAVFAQTKATQTKTTMAKPADGLPRFADFRVPVPIPERKEPAVVGNQDAVTEEPAAFDRRVAAEARKGPNFAGHYTVVIWSCGSPCLNMVIVDIETGKVYETPFVGVTGWGRCDGSVDAPGPLAYRIDSALLVVTGSLEIADPKTGTFDEGPCKRFYYRWDGRRLIRISETLVPSGYTPPQ